MMECLVGVVGELVSSANKHRVGPGRLALAVGVSTAGRGIQGILTITYLAWLLSVSK